MNAYNIKNLQLKTITGKMLLAAAIGLWVGTVFIGLEYERKKEKK